MSTFLSDKCKEIRNWLALGEDVYPDEVVTGWIRMAEEFLSTALRVKHMIQIDTSVIKDLRVPLPLDWQEVRFVRTIPGGNTYRYNTIDDFTNPEFPNPPTAPYDTQNRRYTIVGNYVLFGNIDSVNGTEIEMAYYENIPPLTNDANNWINQYSPTVYTLKILHVASMYAIEDERSTIWGNEVTGLVTGMNARHQVDRASGSTLQPVRRKTFG